MSHVDKTVEGDIYTQSSIATVGPLMIVSVKSEQRITGVRSSPTNLDRVCNYVSMSLSKKTHTFGLGRLARSSS